MLRLSKQIEKYQQNLNEVIRKIIEKEIKKKLEYGGNIEIISQKIPLINVKSTNEELTDITLNYTNSEKFCNLVKFGDDRDLAFLFLRENSFLDTISITLLEKDLTKYVIIYTNIDYLFSKALENLFEGGLINAWSNWRNCWKSA